MKPPFLILLTLLRLNSLSAQDPDPTEIPRFELSACALGFDTIPEVYWLDLEVDAYGRENREYKPIQIGNNHAGSKVEIPTRPPLHLYRKVQNPENGKETTKMEPFMELPALKKGDQYLIVFYRSSDGSAHIKYLDESPEIYPPNTVRVLNLSSRNFAANAGGKIQLVPPGKIKMLGTPEVKEGGFLFTYGIEQDAAPPFQSPTKRLRFRTPQDRLLIIYAYQPEHISSDIPGSKEKTGRLEYRPVLFRLYDRVAIAKEKKE